MGNRFSVIVLCKNNYRFLSLYFSVLAAEMCGPVSKVIVLPPLRIEGQFLRFF